MKERERERERERESITCGKENVEDGKNNLENMTRDKDKEIFVCLYSMLIVDL